MVLWYGFVVCFGDCDLFFLFVWFSVCSVPFVLFLFISVSLLVSVVSGSAH